MWHSKISFHPGSDGHLVISTNHHEGILVQIHGCLSLMSTNTLGKCSSSAAFAKQVACSSQDAANISPKGSTNFTPLSS